MELTVAAENPAVTGRAARCLHWRVRVDSRVVCAFQPSRGLKNNVRENRRWAPPTGSCRTVRPAPGARRLVVDPPDGKVPLKRDGW